jgi:predicted amidohydrolase YtcJ
VIAVCGGLFAILIAAPIRAAELPADFVLTGGRIVTLDSRGTIASAIAIRDERIVYVGDDAGARAFVGPKTDVHDAAGRTVIPGINEQHVHPTLVAKSEAAVPFRQLRSIDEIQAWVRDRVAATPDGTWVVLPRIDVTRVRERRMPNRADLDAAAPDRPAVFIWQYANRQVQMLNSAALRAAGIGRDTVVPAGGMIVRDADGEPTGAIEDAPALTAKWVKPPPPPQETYRRILEDMWRRYSRFGITSVAERRTDVDGWRTYNEMRSSGRLPLRAALTIYVEADGTADGTRKFIESLPFKPDEGDDWVKVGPLKFSVDGGVLYGTSYMREPYGPRAGELYGPLAPEYRGRLQMTPEQVDAVVRTGHGLGWPMCAHVTGDAGVDMVLDAIEAAARDRPIVDRRFTLLHAYFPHEDTAARCARLGVCVDTQPAWYFKDGDALAAALGGLQMSRFIGIEIWRRAGVTVAISSDHFLGLDSDLSLNPYNPFLTMATAVTRKTETGRVFGPDQRVTREQALRMMTVEAAKLHREESIKGTLEVGRLGDLAVLSADYFSCAEDQIPAIRSVLTVVGGRVVHRDDGAKRAGEGGSPNR